MGGEPEPLPATTTLGSLARHPTESDPKHFQPANVNFVLFPDLPEPMRNGNRRAAYAARARTDLSAWAVRNGVPCDPHCELAPA